MKFDLKEIWKKYRKQCIYSGSAVIVIIAIIIVLIATNGSSGKKGDKSTEVITGNQSSYNLKEIENPLVKSEYPEIDTLVNEYLSAKLAGDLDKLSTLVSTIEGITVEDLQKENEYVENFQNVTCYTKAGPSKDTYVVYVYLEKKILNIDTVAPSMIILYVERDEESGGVYIHNGIKEGEIYTYIQQLNENEDVKKFTNEVNDKLVKACESDNNLKQFYDMLIGESATTAQVETTEGE